MKILDKNWIYNIDTQEDIQLKSWIDLKIFDISKAEKRSFFVQENCNFAYRILLQDKIDFDYNFFFEGENSKWDIQILALSQSGIKIKWNINVFLKNKDIDVNVKAVWILWDGWYTAIYPTIDIPKSIKNTQWNVFQESVFLGESGKSFAQPVLSIKSNEIKAFHWVTIQKLDKNKMFYLTSKGIDLENSQKLMLSGYFNAFFEWFNINDEQIKWYLTFFEKKWMNQQIW